MTNEHGLNEQQELFCNEYIRDLNGTKAAIRAKYAEKSAHSQAHDLLRIPKVQERIAALKAERAERLKVTQDDILFKLLNIVAFDPTEVIDGDGQLLQLSDIPVEYRSLIQGIKNGKEGIEVKFVDKLAAIKMLAAHLGMNAPVKFEHTIKDETKTPEETRERIAALQKKLADSKAAEGGA